MAKEEAPLELKSGLIHLLPKFKGLMNEDPYQHLKEFHVVCSSMKPERVTTKQIKLRAFPFSLDGAAKEWLFYLPAGFVISWEGMMRLFLDRYFPSSRVINVRRDICGIKQKVKESLFDYWERFKKLCASCPQHHIPEQSLLHYFYEGLLSIERKSELEVEVVMKKPAEGVQNEEKSSPLDEKPEENLDTNEVQEQVVYELEALKPKLVQVKEEKLVRMLGEYKEAMAYVKDLSLSTCMQRIPLGVNYDHIQEVQRHLNPLRMEVFKNEFQKLLDADMIYLNSDSKWVNQMQVMPNEMDTMVANLEWVDYVAPKPPDKE
ncbi:LRR receptor-like serine/threonine-protein kinase EFR [Senna tora]|uniref:LRR receptor-like serine/threonine-protein kinase EFR n=1 Tax=Senna tora TaxID=362788 RepID=A0A834SWP6_9FABA|nr:LRR receptor-like serine/threonine-protein kinase EFR [Senna tora]